MMKKELVKLNPDIGLLLIRIALGLGFVMHGTQKLSSMPGIIKFFGSLGLPPFMAWLVAITETVSGVAILLGWYTQFAGFAISIVMVTAIALVKLKKGYLGGGYELELTYLLVALGLALTGPGKHSGDVKMPGKAAKAPEVPKQA
jgi:putative oxidoreductase